MNGDPLKNENSAGSHRKLWISEGLILASITPSIYGLGFLYEFGYANYFGIPMDLISVDARTVLMLIIYLIFSVLLLLMWLGRAHDLSSRAEVTARVMGILMFFLFLPFVLFIIRGSWYLLAGLFVFYAVIFLFNLLRLFERKSKRFSVFFLRIESLFVSEFGGERKTEAIGAFDIVGRYFFTPIVIFFVFAAVVYGGGRSNAAEKESFGVIKRDGKQDLAIVRHYGDKIIAIAFDRNQKTFSGAYTIIDLGDLKGDLVFPENIGPLEKLPAN